MSTLETGSPKDDPAPIFAALGDSTRLQLVSRLSDGRARSIVELSDGFDLTRQGVTKHLRVLEQAGIVRSSKIGRENRFTYAPEPIAEIRTYLDRVCEQWDQTLSRLKSFVEDEDAAST